MEKGKFLVYKESGEQERKLKEAKDTLESVKKFIDNDEVVIVWIKSLKE